MSKQSLKNYLSKLVHLIGESQNATDEFRLVANKILRPNLVVPILKIPITEQQYNELISAAQLIVAKYKTIDDSILVEG